APSRHAGSPSPTTTPTATPGSVAGCIPLDADGHPLGPLVAVERIGSPGDSIELIDEHRAVVSQVSTDAIAGSGAVGAKLSMQMTSSPRASRRSMRCEPTN